MISGAEFIELARAAGEKLARDLDMVEVRTVDSGRFALIEWANAKRALALAMDAVQDYSISAEINRTDAFADRGGGLRWVRRNDTFQ